MRSALPLRSPAGTCRHASARSGQRAERVNTLKREVVEGCIDHGPASPKRLKYASALHTFHYYHYPSCPPNHPSATPPPHLDVPSTRSPRAVAAADDEPLSPSAPFAAVAAAAAAAAAPLGQAPSSSGTPLPPLSIWRRTASTTAVRSRGAR